MKESDLHNYQHAAVDHIINNPRCGLILEMGLGKTVSTLTAINKLIQGLEISDVLIVAPKRVAETVWTSECEKWEHLKGLKVSRIIGNEAKRKAAIREKAHLYTIGRDNLAWLVGQYGGLSLPFDMVVLDESSSFKNPKSIRFKALRRASSNIRRIVLLTGTPAPNGLIDLWSQIFLLDRGERLGKTLTSYREKYFTPNQRNGHIVYNYKIQKDADRKIYDQIDDICMSMKASDYLEMPELISNPIKLKMSSALKRKYEDFEREQVLQLIEGGEVTALNAAALSNKLLQFANGAVYDDSRNVHEIHDLKLEAIDEVIEAANGRPVLVAWTYRHDLERLKKKLKKYDPVHLQCEQNIKDWNAGKIQVLLMHPASGGHGLNLQSGGNIIVWFGQTWSLELEQQLNARLYRQGQKEAHVIIHRLITAGTLDEDVIRALHNKSNKQNGLIEAIKSKLKKYEKYYRSALEK